MKKQLTVIVLIALICAPVFAWQQTYRSDSYEYKALMMLGELSGTTFENVVTPVSAAHMERMLKRIDKSQFSGQILNMYEELEQELTSPKVLIKDGEFGLYGNIKIGSDVFLHTNENVEDYSETIKYKDKMPLAEADIGLFFTDKVYAKFDLSVRKDRESSRILKNLGWADLLTDTGNYSQVLPHLAYFSFGNNFYNVTLGRDVLNVGQGITGNLILGGNSEYNDFGKVNINAGKVAYDFTITTASSYEYDDVSDLSFRELYQSNPEKYEDKLDYPDFNSPVKTMLLHRASFTLADRFDISLYEGAVFYGRFEKNFAQALNPVMVFHNTGSYYSGNTNNFFGVEVYGNFSKNWSADLQVIVDQIQLKREEHGEDEAPEALGILFNISRTAPYRNGVLKLWGEVVYNTEGLYLKEKQNNYPMYLNDKKPLYYYYLEDMVFSNKTFTSITDINYMGYPYGGDVKVAAIGASFVNSKMALDGKAEYVAKGYYGFGPNETRYLSDSARNRKTQKGFIVNFKGSFDIVNGVQLVSSVTGVRFVDYQHTNKDFNDIQAFLGFDIQLDKVVTYKRM